MPHSPPRLLSDLAEAERFQLLIEAITDYALYLLDPQGHVASWNPGAQRFKGYTADEIIGRSFSTFYTEEDRAAGLPARALRIATAEGRFEAEGWRVRKDGTRFWTHVVIDPVFAEDGSILGFAKITRDISEKKLADDALRKAEQRFRLLIQGVRDYAIYMLDPEGRVTNWNAGAEAIKGYTAEEIIGRHFSQFYTPEDRDRGEPQRALATALREGKFQGEAQRMRKNGERFWANVLIDPIHDDLGELIGFAKITRDITERRRAEEELERSREALNQAQKIEALGRLTGGVAHDFNNLLTVIRASAELLQRPGLGEEKRLRYTQAIVDTANRAALLTTQLLAFARRQPLSPEIFDVGVRLRGMQHIMKTTVGSAIALELRLPETPSLVDTDPSQFETAVLNMVINARDAMPAGGAITLSVRASEPAPSQGEDAAGFVAIDIADTGTGMSAETTAQIFEPFFTTKAVGKGTGLGLSQVYGFAKQSGGEVEVHSVLGEGTRFTLCLPRAVREAASAGPEDQADFTAVPNRSVLLVEDNESVGAFARGLLEELGQTVTWAVDGQKALEILEQRRDDFDLVFSDVVMPGMSGIELGREIRRHWPALQVVLTSGYSHILAAEQDHGFQLLDKPYSVDGLVSILQTRSHTAAALP